MPGQYRRRHINLPDAPIAHEGFYVAHFFTVKDLAKSRDFYVRILGGKVIKPENPCYIKLVNSWLILNTGGGPTPDKPEVILETPRDLNTTSSFLDLRVADIWKCYKEWSAKGAEFLTEPLDNRGWEWRCYMREPDGYLIEVGQYTQTALDYFKTHSARIVNIIHPCGIGDCLAYGEVDQPAGARYASGRFGSAFSVASSCSPATKRG